MARRRNSFDRQHGGALFVTELLHTLGIVDLLTTFVGVVLLLAFRVGSDRPMDGDFVVLLVGWFVLGITLGGLLLGMAALLRYHYALARSQDLGALPRPEVDQPVTYTAASAPAGGDQLATTESQLAGMSEPESGRQVLSLLREIRDLTLLAPEQRGPVGERILQNQQRRAAEMVIDAVNMRQVGRARVLLSEAEATYGPAPTFQRLSEKIKEADARNEPLDFTRTKRLVEEAIGEGNWSAAEQYAHAAYFDHPDSARCRKLWDDARRARLYAHVQESAAHHHWNEALAAANEFLERFPDSPESATLREQLGTLKANVEILQRKLYENRFKDLVSSEHYAEALRIARHVIDRFPGSPQARALRDQVPALEERLAD